MPTSQPNTDRLLLPDESSNELEYLLYVVSHDLQEPLRMVSGYLSLIERRYTENLDTDGQEFIELAVDGATRMQAMLQALLSLSRIGRKEYQAGPVDVHSLIDDVCMDMADEIDGTGAKVEYGVLPCVNGDEDHLYLLLKNLFENAIKFHGDNNPVIRVSADEVVDNNTRYWRFSVTDNGIGFPEQSKADVFRLFKKLHARDVYSGTGTGLSICKKIVQRHGGVISANSSPGAGSTFYFTLPATVAGNAGDEQP